ncbi:MAG: hypothetical protein QM756_12405 [Polyangiaceae bacterium]
MAVGSPSSGPWTSRAGLSSRTRSAPTFERQASLNILVTEPQILRPVLQCTVPARTMSSTCSTSARRSFDVTSAIGFEPSNGKM